MQAKNDDGTEIRIGMGDLLRTVFVIDGRSYRCAAWDMKGFTEMRLTLVRGGRVEALEAEREALGQAIDDERRRTQ